VTPRSPRGRSLRALADHVAVALMATMFVSFLLQIFFRYVLNRPLGWTEEVTVLCWVWVVLWTASFILSDREEVRFDILYSAAPVRVRRACTFVTSIALIVLLAWSLPATWKYVTFMKREHSAYLHMRFDVLYSIYLAFLVACIASHVRLAYRALRPEEPFDTSSDETGDAP
jgi:TRAP-type C4-dicarboxylate transport system permease small subunit